MHRFAYHLQGNVLGNVFFDILYDLRHFLFAQQCSFFSLKALHLLEYLTKMCLVVIHTAAFYQLHPQGFAFLFAQVGRAAQQRRQAQATHGVRRWTRGGRPQLFPPPKGRK